MRAHCPRVIARQQATMHEAASHAPANPRLNLGDGVGIDADGSMEDDPSCGGGVEHAVDDDAMEVQAGIERRAETLDEGHRTGNANSAAELRRIAPCCIRR